MPIGIITHWERGERVYRGASFPLLEYFIEFLERACAAEVFVFALFVTSFGVVALGFREYGSRWVGRVSNLFLINKKSGALRTVCEKVNFTHYFLRLVKSHFVLFI